MAYLDYVIDGTRHEYELTEEQSAIGRAESCALQFLHDPLLSRVHCTVIRQTDGSFALVDEHSKNGTLLNDQPVPTAEGVPLADEDRITIGKTLLVFRERDIGRTTALFSEVAEEIEEGKGFKTILREIVGKRKS
jgi:pSer/pThr/pTyr-binding forkhead associated (FHA) protein